MHIYFPELLFRQLFYFSFKPPSDSPKKYLFKVLYVEKQLKNGEYIVYLGPIAKTNIPILRATIPFEIIRTDKIIPNYTYDRELTKQERYTVDERVYRRIDLINKKAHRKMTSDCFVLIYGYFVNTYKDVNALTKIERGIQDFHISTQGSGCFNVTSIKTTKCFVTNKWDKVCKLLFKDDKVVNEPEFKKLPIGFFKD